MFVGMILMVGNTYDTLGAVMGCSAVVLALYGGRGR